MQLIRYLKDFIILLAKKHGVWGLRKSLRDNLDLAWGGHTGSIISTLTDRKSLSGMLSSGSTGINGVTS